MINFFFDFSFIKKSSNASPKVKKKFSKGPYQDRRHSLPRKYMKI